MEDIIISNKYVIKDILIDEKIIRVIKNGNTYESATFIDDKKFDLVFDYMKLYKLPFNFTTIDNILVLGGGGFSFPKYVISNYNNTCMDVVEINKDIIDVAYKYFFLDDLYKFYDKEHTRLNIYNEDAFYYIEKCNNSYDVVFMDLFNNGLPVYDFYKDNVLNNISKFVNKILMINYIIDYSDKEYYIEMIKSLRLLYKNVNTITLKELENNKNPNVLIFCSDIPLDFSNCDDNVIFFEKLDV